MHCRVLLVLNAEGSTHFIAILNKLLYIGADTLMIKHNRAGRIGLADLASAGPSFQCIAM